MTIATEGLLFRRPHLRSVLEFVRDHPGCTTAEIMASGLEIGTGDMRRLREHGLVRKGDRAANRRTRWYV